MTDPRNRVILPPYVPFWQRVLLLPFRPAFWLHAAARSIGGILVALLALGFVVNLALGVYRGVEFRTFLLDGAEAWDRSYDPVVYENGRVRVLGDRIVRIENDDRTLLVDPEETVRLDGIQTSEFVVVRSTEIVRKDGFRPVERVPLSDLEEFLGPGPIVLDTAHLQAYVSRYVIWIQIGLALLLALLGPVFDLAGCLLYALPAAGLVFLLKSQAAGLSFGSTYRVALAASSATLVIDLFLNLVGASPPVAVGAPLWITLILGFALAAVFQLEPRPEPRPAQVEDPDMAGPEFGEPSASPHFPG